MSTKGWIVILVAGVAGLVTFFLVQASWSSRSPIQIGTSSAQACDKHQPGDCLPDVQYVDTDGTKYTPDSLKGKVVVVNFWATWCSPCKREIPDLSRTYTKYKDRGVVFLGVLTNDHASSSDLLNFRSDFDMSYPIVIGNSDIMVSFDYPQAIPTTFVFNRSGKRVYSHTGPLEADAFSSLLDQYVAEK